MNKFYNQFTYNDVQCTTTRLKNIGGEAVNPTMESHWDVLNTISITTITRNWSMNVSARKHCAIERWALLKHLPLFQLLLSKVSSSGYFLLH